MNEEISQNSGGKVPVVDNSQVKEKKSVSKPLLNQKSIPVNDIRELVFMIRQITKGKMNFKNISFACGFSPSRISQVLRNWDNPKDVSEKSKEWEEYKEKIETKNYSTKFYGAREEGLIDGFNEAIEEIEQKQKEFLHKKYEKHKTCHR